MIDFSLSDEQRRFVDLAREFSSNEIRPVALQYDRDGTYPESILKKARERGLMYTNIPSAYGGSGMDYVTHYLVTKALNYDCCAIGQMIGISHLSTGAMNTLAEKKGNQYVLNGSKCYITNGQHADLLCVFATMDKTLGTRGISCFAVSRDTPGIRVGRVEDKMGHRAMVVAELFFEDVKLTKENLIGEEGQGFKLAMMALDRGRANITAICTGIAEKALDEATKWAKEREQFGQPIGNFQGVHFMLADMYALIMASRAMYLQVGWMLDRNLKCSIEAAAAKCFASDAAMKVTTDAVQILAGTGYMKGAIVEKLMRDAKLTQIFEGTNQINRIVSGRGVLTGKSILF